MTVLEQAVSEEVEDIGQADVLIGIPSYRNADTISHVVRQVGLGMAMYFPDMNSVIVNSDGGSSDNTRDVVLSTPVPSRVHKIATPYRGAPGKGSAFHTIFEIATRLRVKLCIVVDSDLRSITPEWMKYLGYPILEERFDFVTPHYLRYKYDGTITNSIAYPLTRALYGSRIRQPIGGDFGFSGVLARVYSGRDVWDTDIARFGIDIWMTTLAINEGFDICQACMGLKLHNNKDPGSDLGAMFHQVCGTLFDLMKTYEGAWMRVKGSSPAPVLGEECKDEPDVAPVSFENLLDHFRKGFEELSETWRLILRRENYREVKRAYHQSDEDFEFASGLWVRSVYDFAIAYNFGPVDRNAVVDALTPLYCARTAHFVKKTEEMSSFEAEIEVERVAETFEALKDYLRHFWIEVSAT
ncbi:MAG: glycosyl transferase family 2 [Candidatus Anoxymicrobium japonicum]|uniref:Glucosyl-3-phosphoglycerate synthase n=1 Tax=Candidatus Anoxymicrobium japonicum TaxID=2013648 RepID=A0A2N3G6J4_9ACTN|nr:MAG: glycosyl transferase family 2 [Candidatus Anoxymicrobium japonicum]